ncbi:Putative mycofactocin radical SAM maturase MftC [Burkholderiales bacterium]|nr:Putative mycofactocin radical SAM maturase MftC [Burkholderiales bacterium]
MDEVATYSRALEAFVAEKTRLRREHPLQYLFWEATLRCNLACQHCGSDCSRDQGSAPRELPPEVICRELEAVAQRYEPSAITFAIIGGEPLVRRDIDGVGAYAASLGFAWGITTNGLMLDARRLASLKAAGLTTIAVSLDGLEEDHDRLRNCPGAFRRVVVALERLIADPFYAAFDVICCVSTINVDRLPEFVDFLAALGVPRVRFTPVFSRGRAGRNSPLMLSAAQYRQMLAFIAQERSARKDIEVTLSEEGYWGPQWECRVREGMHYCGSGTVVASILHDGRITGCPSVSRRFIEGDVREASFLEIWEQGFRRFRGGRRNAAPAACRSCEHWVLCEGGGFHLFDPAETGRDTCSLRQIEKQ